MNNIAFDWDTEITCKFTGDPIAADSLHRAKYAEYLTSYLSTYKQTSYVLNLNCAWGTGKSWFLKRWANSIDHKHPVIYLDAWKNDNHNNPLLLILSEIIEQLKTLTHKEKSEAIETIINKSSAVIKAAAPELAKGLVKMLIKADLDKVAQDTSKNLQQLGADSKTEEGVIAAGVKELLSLHSEQKESIDALRKAVESLLDSVITDENLDGNKRWSPMYIFIDELDRCRPTFAIELLEVIKHIFSMRRVIFVIATDTEQLQHSIRAVYGAGFNSQKYLMRFFDRSFALPTPKTGDFLKTITSTGILQERLIQTNQLEIFTWNEQNSLEFLAFIFEGFSLDLRSILQVVERVKGILVNHLEEQGVAWLAVLECMRVAIPKGYELTVMEKAINTSTSSLFTTDIINPLNELAKVKNFTSHHKIKVQISKNATIEKPNVKRPSEYFESEKQALSIKESSVNESITFNALLHLITRLFSSERQKFDEKNTHEAIAVYLMLTENKDINRFREYVEIAANLS